VTPNNPSDDWYGAMGTVVRVSAATIIPFFAGTVTTSVPSADTCPSERGARRTRHKPKALNISTIYSQATEGTSRSSTRHVTI
jgi:hypothetical protein